MTSRIATTRDFDAVIFASDVFYAETPLDRGAFFVFMKDHLGFSELDLHARLPGLGPDFQPRQVIEVIEASLGDAPGLTELLAQAPGAGCRILNADNLALIRRLPQAYRLALVTGGGRGIDGRQTSSALRSHFDSVIDPCLAGLERYDPRLYDLTARRLSCRPERCVFVDEEDGSFEAARATGMTAVHYCRKHGDNLAEQLRRAGLESGRPATGQGPRARGARKVI